MRMEGRGRRNGSQKAMRLRNGWKGPSLYLVALLQHLRQKLRMYSTLAQFVHTA